VEIAMKNGSSSLFQTVMACIVIMTTTGLAAAADVPPTKSATPSKEVREKMATIHEQMATCLRSDKPVAECFGEMKKSCQEMLGPQQGCPMPGMHDHMMKGHPSNTPRQK
jgi:hypothetical protein